MTLIGDLVSLDQQAEFRNDVQLSHYDDPKTNLGLMQSYIFSNNAPVGKTSAVELLDTLRTTFTIAHQENRLVCIANYGHGKSHLALALANYFGKPYGSPELEKVIEKLGKTIDKPSKLQQLRDFRKEHAEFLIIRLRGDEHIGLREQFLTQVQKALQEHEATKDERLGLWSDEALKFLADLSEAQRAKANEFLYGLETDLEALADDVRNNRDQGYVRSRDLFKHLTNHKPDFGGEVSLQKLVKEIAQKYCGEGKPLGGIVILFDEFSLFVQRYATHRHTAGELQALLVGVEELRNKAVFLAFSQHDPKQVARNAANSSELLDSLEKELDRIPRKVLLYSLLESVVDAYLAQPAQAWEQFAKHPQVKGPLARASNVTMDIFCKHYENELHWDTETFDKIVTRGAFPLHPMTTALLCNMSLAGAESIGNPRTLLGFVRQQVAARQNDPALVENQINWILPIFLVDYFADYMGKDAYLQYKQAHDKLPPEAPPEQDRLLKAMLLQKAAEIKLDRNNQLMFLEEAAGVPHSATSYHLQALRTAQCIRFDEANKTYAFWSLSVDPDSLRKLLERNLSGKEITWEQLQALTKFQVKSVPMDVNWGQQDDWEAKEVLITRPHFTVVRLRSLFPYYRLNTANNLEEGVRGGVVWLIPESLEDGQWFKQNAADILDQAFPEEDPLPIVLKLTSRDHSSLIKAYQKLQALEAMTESQRRECGLELFEMEKVQQLGIIERQMTDLRGNHNNFIQMPHKRNNYVIPKAYRSAASFGPNPSIRDVLSECYRLAYKFAPPEFKNDHKENSINLWKSTRLLTILLMKNDISSSRSALQTDRMADDLLKKFLMKRWKIISDDLRVNVPQDGHILSAWNQLEEVYPPGTRNGYVRQIFVKLLNPPYGFDNNTLTLLFGAWIGHHRHELQFAVQARETSLDGLIEILNTVKGKQPFIGEICGPQKLSIERRDSGELIREVQQLVKQVNSETFTYTKAETIQTKLKAHSQDVGLTEEIRNLAADAAKRVEDGVQMAQAYDAKAEEIQREIQSGKDIQVLLSMQKRIKELPDLGIVRPKQASISDLDNAWRESVKQKVNAECSKLSKLNRLQDVSLNQSRLEDLKKSLKSAKQLSLVDLVEAALATLAKREKELEAEERETPVQAEIRAMDKRLGMKTLYGYRERLQEIQGYAAVTQALRDQRLQEINGEISQLEQVVNLLKSRVDTIDSRKSADEWMDLYRRNAHRYEDTEMASDLETVRGRVELTQSFLRELGTYEQAMPGNVEDVTSTLRKLGELPSYQPAVLSAAAVQKYEAVQQRIIQHGQQRVRDASRWLAQLQTRFEQGESIYLIDQEMQKPPAFLPANERLRLEKLRQEVKQKQEADVVLRIEMDFRKISDPKVRQACLERMQQIAAEESQSQEAQIEAAK